MGNYRKIYFDANPPMNGKYRCKACGGWFKKTDIDIDHIIPQNRGGTDSLYNLQALCKHCNRSKQDSMADTIPDLATSVIKNIAQGNSIDNVGGLAANMVKKNTKNAVKKGLKGFINKL